MQSRARDKAAFFQCEGPACLLPKPRSVSAAGQQAGSPGGFWQGPTCPERPTCGSRLGVPHSTSGTPGQAHPASHGSGRRGHGHLPWVLAWPHGAGQVCGTLPRRPSQTRWEHKVFLANLMRMELPTSFCNARPEETGIWHPVFSRFHRRPLAPENCLFRTFLCGSSASSHSGEVWSGNSLFCGLHPPSARTHRHRQSLFFQNGHTPFCPQGASQVSVHVLSTPPLVTYLEKMWVCSHVP